jgi:hypothetical protein
MMPVILFYKFIVNCTKDNIKLSRNDQEVMLVITPSHSAMHQ